MGVPMAFDPNKHGLEKVLRDYQVEALRVVWEKSEEGVTSRDVWKHVNKALEGVKTISRASIINFLNAMCDEGVLTYKEETCKGGMRRKYFPKLSETGFKKKIAKDVIVSLLEDFPEQTVESFMEVIKDKPELKEKLKEL
ncbi:hypothetical protein DRO56_03635 [Candidatus Bathyarchaeota archaeon]|nr:MAG: hypothetical protein CW700_06840 [Candidatus Bathyarchaeota archaeon]RLI32365.1 MAG: hypothetical protein DRO56_03635 [Candidatus Bathyarchaeota archaeon]